MADGHGLVSVQSIQLCIPRPSDICVLFLNIFTSLAPTQSLDDLSHQISQLSVKI